ncbi:MAG: 4-hydroxy-tetrahydrodipicolinate synthase [Flavisolibacter sp.]|nr:4-hydroxy-tetrahydrodipicolinate synthase [Flavisolibacter sp.]
MSMRDQLRGTGVALITPFNSDQSVDFESLHKLINFVIEGGVQYLVILGTTGEVPTLSTEEKKEIIEFSYEIVAGRVPVVVGIGGNNTKALIREIETFPLDKAIAILSVSPYYSKPTQEGIYQHYKALASATAKPIILYNVPGRTGSNITPATAIRLAKDVVNITGIKEASGNMVQCLQLLRDKSQEFFVTSGDDHLAMPQIACGMDGVISVAANCFPRDFSKMVQCALNEDIASAKALNNKLLPAFDLLFAENSPAGVKAFLSALGIIKNYLRLPLVPVSDSLTEDIERFLTSYNQVTMHA